MIIYETCSSQLIIFVQKLLMVESTHLFLLSKLIIPDFNSCSVFSLNIFFCSANYLLNNFILRITRMADENSLFLFGDLTSHYLFIHVFNIIQLCNLVLRLLYKICHGLVLSYNK